MTELVVVRRQTSYLCGAYSLVGETSPLSQETDPCIILIPDECCQRTKPGDMMQSNREGEVVESLVQRAWSGKASVKRWHIPRDLKIEENLFTWVWGAFWVAPRLVKSIGILQKVVHLCGAIAGDSGIQTAKQGKCFKKEDI